VRNQTTATTVFEQTYTVSGALAVNASTPREITFTANIPGTYLVEITADSDQQVFEYDGASHASAELNTATTTFAITQFFTWR